MPTMNTTISSLKFLPHIASLFYFPLPRLKDEMFQTYNIISILFYVPEECVATVCIGILTDSLL
jgi:hypothetical protein